MTSVPGPTRIPAPSTPLAQPGQALAVTGIAAAALYFVATVAVRGVSSTVPSRIGEVVGPLLPSWPSRPWPMPHESQAIGHDAASGRFLGIIALLFLTYGAGIYFAWRGSTRRAEGIALSCGALFLVIPLLSPFLLSSDVFAYALYGRMYGLHADPYGETCALDPADPYFVSYGRYSPS